MWQWPGKIAPGRTVKSFGVGTDIFPTFLEAAGIPAPAAAQLDGISLLPVLTGESRLRASQREKDSGTAGSMSTSRVLYPMQATIRYSERVAMWYKDFEGPRQVAGWIHDFKLHLNEEYKPSALFDMITDFKEDKNLLDGIRSCLNTTIKSKSAKRIFNPTDRQMRGNCRSHHLILEKFLPVLQSFGKLGPSAYELYLKQNPGRVRKFSHHKGGNYQVLNEKQLCTVATDCSCDNPALKSIATLPFHQLSNDAEHVRPKVRNASAILGIASM